MVTSTGTFVSCKDYDDDIDNINKELTDIKSQIAALQTKVNEGKWITNLAPTTGGFTVTFSDGTSYTIVNGDKGETGAAGKDGTTVEVKDGFWYIGGEKTDYVAVTKGDLGKVNVPYVNNEDGYWYFYNEKGEAVKSAYKAIGATYAVDANGIYTLYIPNENGEVIKIELPKYSVTSLAFAESAPVATAAFVKVAKDFTDVNGKEYKKGSLVSTIDAQNVRGISFPVVVNPTTTNAEDIPFQLVQSNNKSIFGQGVASEYTGSVITRSATNGLYSITFALKDGLTKTEDHTADGGYAVVIDGIATNYLAKVTVGAAVTTVAVIEFNDASVELSKSYNLFGEYSKGNNFIKTWTNVVSAKLSVDKLIAEAYGVTVDENNNFTIANAKAGDVINLTVLYNDSEGKEKKATLPVTVKVDPISVATLSASNKLTTVAKDQVTYFSLANYYATLTAAERLAWNAIAYDGLTVGNFKLNSTIKGDDGEAKYKNVDFGTVAFADKDGKKLIAGTLDKAVSLMITVDPKQTGIVADTYTGKTTINGKQVNVELNLTYTSPITRVPVYFSGDNLIAYATTVPTTAGQDITYDVAVAYNNTDKVHSFTVEDKTSAEDLTAGKTAAWTADATGSILTIKPTDLYGIAHKIVVTYQFFENNTVAKATETIYVKAQSPIFDSKKFESTITEISAEAGKTENFNNAKFTTIDAFGKAYKLFATYAPTSSTDKKFVITEGDERISSIEVAPQGDNAKAVKVVYVFAKAGETEVAEGDTNTKAGYSLVGFYVKVNDGTALSTGGSVDVKISVKDVWNKTKDVTVKLNIVK